MSLKHFLLSIILFLSLIINFYQLDTNPPGLYIDEVSIGVNASLILKTGRDEHGVKFPLYFKAYGEYKLPVYIYLTSASMFIFGKNEFAVRFPSAFFGTIAIYVLYLTLTEILKKDTSIISKYKYKFTLLATFVFSLSPWYMHFVGPAFEATVALFFFMSASYLYILFKRLHRISFLVVSLIFYVITLYTYNSYKIIIPITLFLVASDLLKNKYIYRNKLVYYVFVFIIPLFATAHSLFMNQSNVRFLQTTAFSNLSADTLIIFIKNYLSYFSLNFLFNTGDGINRHQFIDFGILSRWTLPFLIVGLYSLIRSKRSLLKYLVFGFLLISPIPAATSLPSPHTLRSLPLVIPYSVLISIGVLIFLNKFSLYMKYIVIIISIIFFYEFSGYLHYNFFHYPKTALLDWGGNFKELSLKASKLKNKYPIIAIDESLSDSLEYLRFYDESLEPILVKPGWNKTDHVGNTPVLLITSDISGEIRRPDKLVDTVYLPNLNKNIFAQFWEL